MGSTRGSASITVTSAPKAREDVGELDADRAGADDDQRVRAVSGAPRLARR